MQSKLYSLWEQEQINYSSWPFLSFQTTLDSLLFPSFRYFAKVKTYTVFFALSWKIIIKALHNFLFFSFHFIHLALCSIIIIIWQENKIYLPNGF